MTTTAQVLIQAAYRENNLLGAGKSPTTDEQTEALALLNNIYLGVFGFEMGEELTDWPVPQPQRTASLAYNAPQYPRQFCGESPLQLWKGPPVNSRIVFGGVTNTIYFPEQPNDGSRMAVVQGSGAGDSGAVGQILTLDGNGRTIETTATKTFTFASPAAAPKQWLYRADLADWVVVQALTLTDQMPFPQDVDDLWITALNIRLAPRFGKAVTQETTAAFKRAQSYLKARYRQAMVTTYGARQIRNTDQSYSSRRGW